MLDTGARKIFIRRELISQIPGYQVVQHAAADTLQIWLPNGEDVQSKGKVTLEANIEKLQVILEADILSVT